MRKKPGPKGPSPEVSAAVVQMKQRNPTWGCPRIAQQIALAIDIQINKDVVRWILDARYQPEPDSTGPSWLTFLGHMKDSLWSLDLFRCESATLLRPADLGNETDDYGFARFFRELVVGFVRFGGAGQEVSRPSSRSPRIPTLRA